MKKILLILSASFFLFACGNTQRDIFDPQTEKSFVEKPIESPFFGDPKAKVQIMIFEDFQCPACIYFEKTIGDKLLNDYALTNKIGFTFKNYPLSIHKNAPEDALAGLCAQEQGKFKDFAKNMFAYEEQKNGLRLTKDDRMNVGKQSGLDLNQFSQCIDEGRYVGKIKQDMAEGDKLGLQGTPSVYANGQLIQFDSVEGFFKIIDQLLTKQES